MRIANKGGIVAAPLLSVIVLGGAGCAYGQQAASATKANVSAKFLLEYQGQGDSDVRKDPQFEPLLRGTLPQPKFFAYGLTLMKAIPYYIGVGSGRVTVDDGRYAVVTGCVPHMCDTSEGLLWVDTQSAPPNVLFAAIDPTDDTHPAKTATYELWIYGSRQLNADANHGIALPDDFVKQLEDFVGGWTVASATFVEPNSTQISLSPTRLLLLSQPNVSGQPGSSKGTQ